VVAVETVSGDPSEHAFDGDNVAFAFGPNPTFGVTPTATATARAIWATSRWATLPRSTSRPTTDPG